MASSICSTMKKERRGSNKAASSGAAAYNDTDPEKNPIDFCLTHCAMMPQTEMLSSRMRNKLERLREKVMANEEWMKTTKNI